MTPNNRCENFLGRRGGLLRRHISMVLTLVDYAAAQGAITVPNNVTDVALLEKSQKKTRRCV